VAEPVTEPVADPKVDVVAAGAGPYPRWRTLGRLAPAVLAAWLVADVGLRFVSPSLLWVNPIGAALRAPPSGASFEPNYSAVTKNYVGDAVLEANQRQAEHRAPLRFSADALGFRRNPYVAPGEPYDVLQLGGASFGFGGALSDEETLPAAITRVSGLRVYNGGTLSSAPSPGSHPSPAPRPPSSRGPTRRSAGGTAGSNTRRSRLPARSSRAA